jgi:hypothetical protein
MSLEIAHQRSRCENNENRSEVLQSVYSGTDTHAPIQSGPFEMSPWWRRRFKPKDVSARSISNSSSTIVNSKESSASISSYATQESLSTEKRSIISDADTLSSPSPSPQGKETNQLGWKILDKLILFLNIANQVLSGVPFQGAIAAPLELLRSFQASYIQVFMCCGLIVCNFERPIMPTTNT